MNADALSCLPLPVEPVIKQPPPEIVLVVDHLDNSLISAHHVQECTRIDPQLAQIVQFVQQGWPNVFWLCNYLKRRGNVIYCGCFMYPACGLCASI